MAADGKELVDTLGTPNFKGSGPGAPTTRCMREHVFWRREAGQAQIELLEYSPTSEDEAAENSRRSVFFHPASSATRPASLG
jgi:hypothetical protein